MTFIIHGVTVTREYDSDAILPTIVTAVIIKLHHVASV